VWNSIASSPKGLLQDFFLLLAMAAHGARGWTGRGGTINAGKREPMKQTVSELHE
jgi:hypothetical protein